MQIGKYQVESNNNGTYYLRFLNKKDGNYYKHIISEGDLENHLNEIIAVAKIPKDTEKVIDLFRQYCRNPIDFYSEKNIVFLHSMTDKLCFEQLNFTLFLEDFIHAYNTYNDAKVKYDDVCESVWCVEQDWKRNFFPDGSGFQIEVHKYFGKDKKEVEKIQAEALF